MARNLTRSFGEAFVRPVVYWLRCLVTAAVVIAVVTDSNSTAYGRTQMPAALAYTPVLLSEAGSTRAIALDAVTWRREPFTRTAVPAWSPDQRTRLMLFAINVNLANLAASETATTVVTAEAEDGVRRRYPLAVEYVGPVPGHEWMSAIIVRLHDEISETGDVLVRISVRGVPSNRVRIGIGGVGGGPLDDAGAVATPAPPTPPSVPSSPAQPPPSNPYLGGLASFGDAVRLLEQATYGPSPTAISRVQAIGIKAYLDEQLALPPSAYPELPPAPATAPANATAEYRRDNYTMHPLQVRFFQNALTGSDQLRQRVAFALSQIFVVSGVEIGQPSQMAPYLRLLTGGAFGNFRELLRNVTLNPAMGRYLNMANNDKPNPRTGVEPNENYARELLQLFSIGVFKLNQNGTLQLDGSGRPIPTYDQETIEGFAHAFTGWTYAPLSGAAPQRHNPSNYLAPMVAVESNHDIAAKRLLDGAVLPAGQSAEKDLNDALDNIFNHQNVAPFICKQLIQHLVTSNPTPDYVGRVAAIFNNNGAGVRGDLRAVVQALLLDPEARGDSKADAHYGHLREPVLFVTNLLRAFGAASDGVNLASYTSQMGQNLFYSPSVFNYYPPTYKVPGTALTGPEFGIQTTATALARSNFVNTIVFGRIAPPANSPAGTTGTSLDLTWLQSFAAEPTQLINWLDALLLHGTMTPVMRGVITQAVMSVPANQPLTRVRTAVYLVATSSQYQVER